MNPSGDRGEESWPGPHNKLVKVGNDRVAEDRPGDVSRCVPVSAALGVPGSLGAEVLLMEVLEPLGEERGWPKQVEQEQGADGFCAASDPGFLLRCWCGVTLWLGRWRLVHVVSFLFSSLFFWIETNNPDALAFFVAGERISARRDNSVVGVSGGEVERKIIVPQEVWQDMMAVDFKILACEF